MKITLRGCFFFALILYYVLTAIFPNVGYGDNQVSERIYPQFVMGVIGIFCLVLTILDYKRISASSLLKPFLPFILLGLLYVFFTIKDVSVFKNLIYFLKMDMAILCMFAFYHFLGKNYESTHKAIMILFFVQFCFTIYTLLLDKFTYQTGNDVFNSNAGFGLVASIPMTLLIENKRLRIYAYLAITLGCLFSGQRSAALAALISIPFSIEYLKDSLKKNDIIILSILGVVAIYPIIEVAYHNIMERMAVDSQRGDIGSGRSIFWMIALEDFFNRDFLHWIFGNGYFAIQNMLRMRYGMAIEAHNGWIQNLYMYGFFGFFLYLRMAFNLLSKNKLVNHVLPQYTNVLLICFIIFFIKSTTSHGNWDISVIPFAMSIAIIADGIRRNQLIYR